MINGQMENSNFPWFWQVGTYSLGSAQCHIQGQVIGAGLKTITEIGNKGLHIVTSFDWVQISIFSCPPKSGHAYESTEYLDPLKGRPFFVCQHFDPPLAVESIDASDEGFNELKGTVAIHGVKTTCWNYHPNIITQKQHPTSSKT